MFYGRGRRRLAAIAAVCVVLAMTASPVAAYPRPGATERVSVATDGTQPDNGSQQAKISADGRYVAFQSFASNLVPGDTNGASDVFVHDRETGTTERMSVAADGTEGNAGSWAPSLSADGRYVAFDSAASNLVPGDTNRATDVYVHDRETGTTERVSVAASGAEANGGSWSSSISADGRHVAFNSWAANVVPGDTNGISDVFVRDRYTRGGRAGVGPVGRRAGERGREQKRVRQPLDQR